MKVKWVGSSFITFSLVLIVVLFYLQNLIQSETIAEPEINQNVPLPIDMHPIVKERTHELIQKTKEKGIVIVITDSFRSAEDQDRLFAKGRSLGGNIVTHAKGGESYHNYGLAVDFAIKEPSGNIIWDMKYDGNRNSVADWTEVVTIAKELGFEWGGDWARFKDYPHLQMDFGLTIAELQSGERPPGSSLTADSE